ncbi:hypothetical protein [Actibacterium sp. D379-3]
MSEFGKSQTVMRFEDGAVCARGSNRVPGLLDALWVWIMLSEAAGGMG